LHRLILPKKLIQAQNFDCWQLFHSTLRIKCFVTTFTSYTEMGGMGCEMQKTGLQCLRTSEVVYQPRLRFIFI
jgi:hypothetical protein